MGPYVLVFQVVLSVAHVQAVDSVVPARTEETSSSSSIPAQLSEPQQVPNDQQHEKYTTVEGIARGS
jgi:hypothetical protein